MTDEAMKRKILMNHIKLQERTIEQIVRYAIDEFNIQSCYAARLNARLSEIDGEEYFEADGRRTQARNTLAKIADMAEVKIGFESLTGTTRLEGEPIDFHWCEAFIMCEEDCDV